MIKFNRNKLKSMFSDKKRLHLQTSYVVNVQQSQCTFGQRCQIRDLEPNWMNSN